MIYNPKVHHRLQPTLLGEKKDYGKAILQMSPIWKTTTTTKKKSAEDRRWSFILCDTSGIPCSHLRHSPSTSALLTAPLINHDNSVFYLALTSQRRDKLLFWEPGGETAGSRPPKCPKSARWLLKQLRTRLIFQTTVLSFMKSTGIE